MVDLDRIARRSLRIGPLGQRLGRLAGKPGIESVNSVVEAAPYVLETFGDFSCDGIEPVLPIRTFDDSLTPRVGDKRVEPIEVGPVHTKGDVIVHVPDDKVLYTGDILFIGGHPIVWEGPASNWIAACGRIQAMDLDDIVPGHCPLTDRHAVARAREYLSYLEREARARFDAGVPAFEAARDIDLRDYADLGESERLVVNVDTVYREFAGAGPRRSALPCFAAMARFAGKARSSSQPLPGLGDRRRWRAAAMTFAARSSSKKRFRLEVDRERGDAPLRQGRRPVHRTASPCSQNSRPTASPC